MSATHASFVLESEAFPKQLLRVESFRASERIGGLFQVEIEVSLPTHHGGDAGASLAADAVVGAAASFVVDGFGEVRRRFDGLVSRVRHVRDVLNVEPHMHVYHLVLVPKAHRLRLVTTQDIFQDMTVPEIVQHKLALIDLEGSALRVALGSQYPKREFVVQYEESDLAFVSRLAEHAGISMFFEHDEGETRMVLADNEGSFPFLAGETFVYRTDQRRDVFRLGLDCQLVPATFVVYDYNYRSPLVDVRGQTHGLEPSFGGVAEFGSHIKSPEEGAALAAVRSEELRATQRVYDGESTIACFAAGSRFRLDGHPTLGREPLLLTEVIHEGTRSTVELGSDVVTYHNRFSAVPSGFTYRPPRITPRPRLHGVVTAIIEGVEGGSSAYAKLDDEGRYTVQFLFDVGQSGPRYASRAVRMAQPHTGAGYGMHFPLRPGVEVLVAFVNGDPDRPIIVGAAPNPLTPSPVQAVNPNHNLIRTRSGVRLLINDGGVRKDE